MLYPGIKNLGDAAITAAVTNSVITSASDAQAATQGYIDRLEGMIAATISANFVYGSGGTSVKVIIEETENQGLTWTEVARFAFTTASAEKKLNLSGLTDKLAAYTPIALSDDTAISGLFGDRFRAKITSLGTYGGNTSISVRLNAR